MPKQRDFQFKFRHAQRYLDDLAVEEQGWFKNSLQILPCQKHPDRPGYFIQYAIVEAIPIDPFALLVGDIVNNLRGTLDHVAYTLAVNHQANLGIPLTDKIKNESQFPIFGDASDYAAKVKRYLAGVDPAAEAIIKRCQPFNRRKHFVSHPLWMLQALSNIDKHRLLLTTALNSFGGIFKGNFISDDVIVRGGFLEGQAEIVTFSGRPIDPSKEMNVQYVPVVDIAFRYGGALDGESVRPVLRGAVEWIARIITLLDHFL